LIKELRKNQKKYAIELRKANRPYSEVSTIIGVPEGTIKWWEAETEKKASMVGTNDACIFKSLAVFSSVQPSSTDLQKFCKSVDSNRLSVVILPLGLLPSSFLFSSSYSAIHSGHRQHQIVKEYKVESW
jgi:hypothetical protein